MSDNLEPANAYELVWCEDVRAALRFYEALFPDASTTLHRSRQYAEVDVRGRIIALAATDITQKAGARIATSRPVRVITDVGRGVYERAVAIGATVLPQGIIQGPGVQVAVA